MCGGGYEEQLNGRGAKINCFPSCEVRDTPNLTEAQEISVGTDDVVGAARRRAFEEFVVCGIPAHANRDIRTNERGSTSDLNQHSSSLAWRHSEFPHHIRAHGDCVDFGE